MSLRHGAGNYVDPVVNAERVLESYFTGMLERKEKQGKQNERKAQLHYAIQRCVDTDDIAIFVGYCDTIPSSARDSVCCCCCLRTAVCVVRAVAAAVVQVSGEQAGLRG
jgi:hypothetical protein